MPSKDSIIQFKFGLQTNYDKLTKDANTIYFTTDEQRFFVGDVEYSRPVGHGSTLPAGYNPPNSLFVKELTGGGTELYYSKDGAAWTLVSAIPASIAAGVVGANTSTTLTHGGNIVVPKVTYDAHGAITAAEDQTLTLPTETAVSVTQGAEPGEATTLGYGDTFSVVSDVTKGTGSHEIKETLAKFQLPNETEISVDSPASTAGGDLTHGGTITVVTGVAKGDSSHNVDVTTKSFTLPSETQGSGDVTGSAVSFVKSVTLSGHTLSGTVQEADDDVATGTSIPTTAAVKSYVDSALGANDAMVYKGTLDATSDGIYTPAANCGDTYKVSAAGKVNGVNVQVGDMFICTTDNTEAATSTNAATVQNNWNVIQANIDGALIKSGTYVSDRVLVADGTSGKVKDSGFTIGTSVPADAKFTDTTYSIDGALQSDGSYDVTLTGNTGEPTTASIPVATGGNSGLVPTATADEAELFLRGDGTWVKPDNTEYGADRGISLTSGKFGHSNTAITANTSGLNTDQTLDWGSATTLKTVKYDQYGHITGTEDFTLTMPAKPADKDENVKSTAAASGTLYLTGVTAAGTSGVSIVNAADKAVTVNAGTGAVTAGGGFVGNLSGNATSSTKATQDADGNVITETYATKAELTSSALVWGSF